MCVYTIHTRWGTFSSNGDNYETDMYEEEQYGVRFWQLEPHPSNPAMRGKHIEVFIPWANVHSIIKREGRVA